MNKNIVDAYFLLPNFTKQPKKTISRYRNYLSVIRIYDVNKCKHGLIFALKFKDI